LFGLSIKATVEAVHETPKGICLWLWNKKLVFVDELRSKLGYVLNGIKELLIVGMHLR